MRSVLVLSVVLFALSACKPQVPSDYIQPGDMEDILYDYHVAQCMVEEDVNDAGTTTAMLQMAYRSAVLRKHGVSEAEFDSSLVYYMRHTERLHAIYKNLATRLTNEAQSLGATASDINRFGALTAEGDTANIWIGDKSLVLSPYVPFNQYSFSVKADTAFHKRDQIMLQFRSQFIYQDGMRDGTAYLAIVYSNDSVATQNCRITSDTQHTIQLSDDKELGIKEVKGFFYLGNGQDPSLSTLKLMCISDIRLIRMHQPPVPKKAKEEGDSIKRKQLVDSLKQVSPQMPNGRPVPSINKDELDKVPPRDLKVKPAPRENSKTK